MATTLQTVAIIRAKDMFSGPVTRMANRVLAAQRRIQTVSRAARSVGTGMSVGVTAPLGMIGRYGFQAAYNFEKVKNRIQAVSGVSDDALGKLSRHFKALNKDFPFTNAQIAGAALELFRAGLKLDQVYGTLRNTLSLAQAGDISRSEAADIATNVLTAMRLPMETAAQAEASMKRVADVIAYAANRSNTDVRKMGQTFKYVAPMAAAAGISIEKVGAMAMVMANNGIKADEAGVALRSSIIKMVRPSTFAQKALAGMGISLGDYVKQARELKGASIIKGLQLDGIDASGLEKRFDRLLSDSVLRQKPAQLVATLTDEIARHLGSDAIVDKATIAKSLNDSIMAAGNEVDLMGFVTRLRKEGASVGDIARIFGTKQGSRAMTLLTADLEAKELEIISRSKGASERAARIMMKGIIGTTARLKASWENLWITIGETGVLDNISSGFNRIAVGLENMAKSNPQLLKFATYALGALMVIGPLGIMIGGVASAFGALSGVLGLVATGFRAVSAASGAGAMAGLMGLGRGGKVAKKGIRGLPGRLRSMAAGLFMLGQVGGVKAMLKAVGSSLLAFGKSPFKLIAGGLRMVQVAAMALLGTISWPVLLGAAAVTLIIGRWQELKAFFSGFWDELKQGIEGSKLGEAFNRIAGWAETPIRKIKELWGWIKRVFGYGGSSADKKRDIAAAGAAGRASAQTVLGWVGLGKKQGAQAPIAMNAKTAAAAKTAGTVINNKEAKVHAPATVTINVTSNADPAAIGAAVNSAMNRRDAKLKSSLRGAFND